MEFARWNVPSKSSIAPLGKGAQYQQARSGGSKRSVPPLDEEALEELDLMPTKVRRTHMDLASARDEIAQLQHQLAARDQVIDILVGQLRGSSSSSSSSDVMDPTKARPLRNANYQIWPDPVIPGAGEQLEPFNNTTISVAAMPQFTNYMASTSAALAATIIKPGSNSPVVDPNVTRPGVVATTDTEVAIATSAMRTVKPSAAPTSLLSTVGDTAKSVKAVVVPAPAAAPVAVKSNKPAAAPAAPVVALQLQHPAALKQKAAAAPPVPVVVAPAGVDDELEEYEEEAVEEEAATAAEEEAAAAAEEEEAEEEEEDPVHILIKVSAKKPPMGFFMMPSTGYLHRVAKDADGDPAVGELVAKYDQATKTIVEQYVTQL